MRVGTVDSLWRYPVKSMRGEQLDRIFVGFAGVYGDRLFAFKSSASPEGFPYFTAREQQMMLRYRPYFRSPSGTICPPNLAEASAIGQAGVTPVYGDADSLAVDVEDPTGRTLSIDDPRLIEQLTESARDGHKLSLLRSDRAFTDCRPVSIISMQTAREIEKEVGTPVDHRSFRANIYADLDSSGGFGEDSFVGCSLRIGSKVVIAVLQRDARCKMITLDPETGDANPEVMRKVSSNHEGMAGVYCAVLVEGIVNQGDPIEVID